MVKVRAGDRGCTTSGLTKRDELRFCYFSSLLWVFNKMI